MVRPLVPTPLLALAVCCFAQVAPPGAPRINPPNKTDLPPFIEGVRLPAATQWTSIHWEGGMPELGASGQRVVESGAFWVSQNTGSLNISAFGGFGDNHPGAYAAYDLDAEADPKENSPQFKRRAVVTRRPMPTGLRVITITVDGIKYEIKRGKPWDGKTGPRLIESGRFLQRADILGLDAIDSAGRKLDGEFRFETTAWPDRLTFSLHARPPLESIPEGQSCFGVRGGGFGLTGSNHHVSPHHPSFNAQQFTFELWVYVPEDATTASRQTPWIACRGANEESPGGFGFALGGSRLAARFNGTGGRTGARLLVSPVVTKTEAWNHVALTFDGSSCAFFVNGIPAGRAQTDGPRAASEAPLTLGRRGDGHGDGYHFKGAVDEVRLHTRVLTAAEIGAIAARKSMPDPGDGFTLSFDEKVAAKDQRVRNEWKDVRMWMRIGKDGGNNDPNGYWDGPTPADASGWHRGFLTVRPDDRWPEPDQGVRLMAEDKDTGAVLPVTKDAALGCFKVDLDSVRGTGQGNDILERVRLRLSKPSQTNVAMARVMFTKTGAGLRHAKGTPITGITAVLRTPDGIPTGIPVQLSKNWHTRPEAGEFTGQWFHGVTMINLDYSGREAELELALAYGHWGRLPAVTHSQLSLIGWGSNQLWDQAALGSWGENFCFEPDRAQRGNIVMDVRPLMVTGMRGEQWNWTNNVGGADWFIIEPPAPGSMRLKSTDVRTAYVSQGPCLSKVVYSALMSPPAYRPGVMSTRAEVSIGRTTDIARASYRLRLDVVNRVDVGRCTIFQMGSEQYNYPREESFALGDAGGLLHAWKPTPHGKEDGRTILGTPREMKGVTPWVSLHGGKDPLDARTGAYADRGFIIRSWQAVLGGKPANPWIVERDSLPPKRLRTVTLDLVAPPDVKTLVAGDYVEAIIEHVVIPQRVEDYYGPDESLRDALRKHSAPEMVLREAKVGAREVTASVGQLRSLHPSVSVECQDNRAEITLAGGVGHVPLRFSGLTLPPRRIRVLLGGKPGIPATPDNPAVPAVPGEPLDPTTHGPEFWQIEPSLDRRSYAFVINLPASEKPRRITVGEPLPPPAELPAKDIAPR